jgi:hypothetical protein
MRVHGDVDYSTEKNRTSQFNVHGENRDASHFYDTKKARSPFLLICRYQDNADSKIYFILLKLN